MDERVVDAVEEFAAARIYGPDGRPIISNGFSREKLDLTEVEYFSAQRIGELRESPRHFQWKYILGNRKEETDAQRLGKLMHWALLQPKEFLSRYIIKPKFEGEGMKKRAKEWEEALAPDAIVLTLKEANSIDQMIKALYAHPRASKLLAKGTPEVHTFYTDPEFKDELGRALLWYGILDFFRSGNWVIEIKTSRSARLKDFKRDAYDYGYHVQTWKYRRMVHGITGQKPNVLIIVIENVEPYCVQLFEPTSEWYDHANYEVTLALEDYRKGMTTGFWPAYSENTVALSGPAPWQKSRFEEEGYE